MIFEVAFLSLVLSTPPRRSSSHQEHEFFSFSSNPNALSCAADVNYVADLAEGKIADNLERALARDLASIRDVRHVLTEKAEGALLVWIAIDQANSYEVRSRIYDKELALIDGFPEIDFDFNLVAAMNRDPRELASSAQIVYSRS